MVIRQHVSLLLTVGIEPYCDGAVIEVAHDLAIIPSRAAGLVKRPLYRGSNGICRASLMLAAVVDSSEQGRQAVRPDFCHL